MRKPIYAWLVFVKPGRLPMYERIHMGSGEKILLGSWLMFCWGQYKVIAVGCECGELVYTLKEIKASNILQFNRPH